MPQNPSDDLSGPQQTLSRILAHMQAGRFPEAKALCEDLLLCFAAGKPLLVDPYNARQMILTGRLDEASLLADVRRHRSWP